VNNNGHSTVNISQFVNSPAASGGSGRGVTVSAGGVRNEKNAFTHHRNPSGQQKQPLEGKQQQQSVAPIAGSQSTAPLQNVQDLVQMYTANTTTSVATKSNQSAPSVAVASTAVAPTAAVATKPHGRSRFAPASMPGKTSNNPFASIARVPIQPEVRPQQQYQKQKQNQKRPQEMAMAPRPPQQQPGWFRGPTEGVQSQKTASLGSLFNFQGTTTSSYAQPQAWQRNPQQQQQQQNKGTSMVHKQIATTPLRLPSRAALGAPQSQPSVSLHDALFSNSTEARDPTQILNNSIFFSGGPQQNTESVGAGGAGWNGGSDQREVTSPLKGQVRHHVQNTTTTTKVEKPIAVAPRLPLGQQPRAQNNAAYLSQQQQQQQQTNSANASAWNVRRPTASSFNSLETSRSTSSGGKRKSGDGSSGGGGGGGKKKSSKADKKMQAAAANCARISAFFAPKKHPGA
jgi:hypothetical protein